MTVKIEKYINKRYSTRNLSDVEFENIIDDLAQQLESYDYHTNYSESDLKKDWDKLCNWNTTDSSINSTSRIGMKLCEHFFLKGQPMRVLSASAIKQYAEISWLVEICCECTLLALVLTLHIF